MIDEGLYAQVRSRATKANCSVSWIVAEALRGYLAERPKGDRKPIKLTPAQGGGWIGSIDTRSNVAMLDALDAELPLDKLR